jgi:diacylglycerol kinase (ATP)
LGHSRGRAPIATYRQGFLVYNPSARGLEGQSVKRIDRALAALHSAGHCVSAVQTQGRGTASGIARECVRGGADLILVAGGDGTINEVANGMIHEAVPLGILPAGTGNVLATELGLRGRLDQVARQVGDWVPWRIGAGLLIADGGAVHRHFLMMAGVGFDAPIIRRVDPALKKNYGTLSYWIAGLGELNRELDEFEVWLDGASRRCTFALASRVRNYGGTVEIARHAGLLREDFGVVLLEGRNTFLYLEYLAGVLADRLGAMSGASVLHAKRIEFRPGGGAPVYVQVDGELAGQLPAKVEIVPDALTLLAPPGFLG